MTDSTEAPDAEPEIRGSSRYFENAGDDIERLMGENPQALHVERMAGGIELTAPGMVTLRKMADITALTRSKVVRQFGFGDATADGGGLGGRHVAIPLELNGAEHTMWRKFLDPVFAPKKIAVLEERVREEAGKLIDGFIDRGEVDAYLEWSEPLPSTIFLSIMGIPQEELEHFLEFKNTILSAGAPLDEQPTFEQRMAAFDACDAWFASEFDRREAAGDYGEDVIGWLMQVEPNDEQIKRIAKACSPRPRG